jgi:hypothetical protein
MRWGQLEVRVRWSEWIDLRLLFLFIDLFVSPSQALFPKNFL